MLTKPSAAVQRAMALWGKPEIRSWIKRFQEVVDQMPQEIMVFVGDPPAIMALDENKKPFVTLSGGMDQKAVIANAAGGTWGGGDW